MTAKLKFFPLGNADTTLIDLADGRKVLVDYAAMSTDEDGDRRCDLRKELIDDLRKDNRNDIDVVCITHIDSDHCKGFGDAFWLEHAAKYQGDNRIAIKELWVPAAAILEEGVEGDARIVRSEARHRLVEGKGIRVFSRPDCLKDWMKRNGVDFAAREHLIVDAGKTVPGFKKTGSEKVEFFVHCPFGWRQDEHTVIDRNGDSIVLHATFLEGSCESRLLTASDVDYETLSEIVDITRDHKNDERLRWDIMKLPHHCSYKSLGPERGDEETKPEKNIKWLFEDQQGERAVIVSSSDPIPEKGSKRDDDQPPHRQAASYCRRVVAKCGGEFVVTMEPPAARNLKPLVYEVTKLGIALCAAAPMISRVAAASTPKAG